MEIAIHSSKVVKPIHGGRGGWDTQAVDAVLLTPFDLLVSEYMTSIQLFHPPSPSNAVLEEGLSKALGEYREWAGRLGVDRATGRRAILLNDAGARLIEATADVALESIMPLLPGSPVLQSLHPSINGAEELMLVQITRFACGSFVVGHAMHHTVGDGFAICQCLLAWGQATRGVAIDPVPVHDRKSFFIPRDPPKVEFEHRGAELIARDEKDLQNTENGDATSDNELVTHELHFSREFISSLKSRSSSTATIRPYSMMQCLVAHIWQCIAKARGLTGDEVTQLHIGVNGRARMVRPRVPEGYTGNVLLWARPATTARELLGRPLGHASELISREVVRVDDAYFRSFIDFMSSGAMDEEGLVSRIDTAEFQDEVYSLQRIRFYDLDFGGGRQFLYVPSYRPVNGLIYILPPSPKGDGSVDVQVSLCRHAMNAFKVCCYCLTVPYIQSKI
ncbi:unnamed protein product [Urochloa humidicola]